MSYKPTAKDFEQYEDEEEKNAKPLPDTETTALGAGLRAFARAPISALGALGFPKEHLVYPQWAHEKPGDIKHPFAEFAGSSAWPIGGLAGKLIKGAKTVHQLTKIKDLEGRANQAEEAHMGSEEALKDLQTYFKERHGSEKPNFGHKIQESIKKISELEPDTETSVLAEKPKTDLSNRLPGGTGEGLIPQAENQLAQHRQVGQQYLGHGQSNDVRFQDEMHHMITSNRAQIGEGYNNLKSAFEEKNVAIPNSKSLQELHSELDKLIRSGEHQSPEALEVLTHIQNFGKNNTVPASQLLQQFRTLDKLAKQTYSKAFERSESMTEQQRQSYKDQGKLYREKAEEISKIMEGAENLPADFRETLQNLNSQWREYAKLYSNPLAKEIEARRGIAGSNIMSKMRGSDEGQQLLRNLTLSNPETIRTAIGHTYSENPHAMLEAPEHEQQFIMADEHLPGYLERARSHQQNLERAHQETQRRQEEGSRVKKAYEEDVAAEKQKSEARNKVAEADKKKSEIKKLVEEYIQHMKEHEALLSNKKMTLEQKMRAGQKLESIKKVSDRIKKLGKGLGYATLISGEIGVGKKILETLFK